MGKASQFIAFVARACLAGQDVLEKHLQCNTVKHLQQKIPGRQAQSAFVGKETSSPDRMQPILKEENRKGCGIGSP